MATALASFVLAMPTMIVERHANQYGRYSETVAIVCAEH